jgi:hypothetical protein
VQDFACELVIVTEVRQFDRIARAGSIAQLLRYVDLRLLPVDDLLSPWYGISLTYALVRGFVDLGAAMTRTHLLFLNADFIIADGSYRRLADAIKRGERLVVSPSYCMNLEDTVDLLRERRDPDTGAVAIPPRDLARMIIEHRHNTIRAKTINQKMFRIHRYDQFYLYKDASTLLCRQLPIAVVYMRPERVLTEMPTFWDYGVISEYCPTTQPCVLGDSDDFLMAELRSRSTFRELLHLGWPTVEEIAADLSSFTTRDHHDYGRFTLILHADDVPADIETAKAELGRFVDAVYAGLRPPIGYREHPFWAPQFPQFTAYQQRSQEERSAGEAAREALTLQDAGAAECERRIRALRAQLLVGAERQRLAERRLFDRCRLAQQRLSRLEAEHRHNRGLIEEELARATAEQDGRLRDMQREFALLESEVAALQAEQDRQVRRLLGGSGDGPLVDMPASAGAWKTRRNFLRDGVLAWCGGIYRHAFGPVPRTTRWHPYHRVLRPVMAAVAAKADIAEVLIVSSGGVFAPLILRDHSGAKVAITTGLLDSQSYRQSLGGRPRFDLCLFDLSIEDLGTFRRLFDTVRSALAENARVIVFHHNASGQALDALTYEFTRGLFPLVGRSEIAFAGSRPGSLAMRWFAAGLARFNISRPTSVLRLAAVLSVCAPLARMAAWLEPRRPPHVLPTHCSSMTITIDLP